MALISSCLYQTSFIHLPTLITPTQAIHFSNHRTIYRPLSLAYPVTLLCCCVSCVAVSILHKFYSPSRFTHSRSSFSSIIPHHTIYFHILLVYPVPLLCSFTSSSFFLLFLLTSLIHRQHSSPLSLFSPLHQRPLYLPYTSILSILRLPSQPCSSSPPLPTNLPVPSGTSP